MENIRNILVPTDFSVNSISALRYAASIARNSPAIIHILHCIEALPGMESEYPGNHLLISKGIARLRKEMKKFTGIISSPHIKIKEVIKTGKPYDQILRYSRDSDISIIILASNNWSGKGILMLGQVAKKVVKYSKIPVLLIKNNDPVYGKNFSPVMGNSAAT